MPSRSSKCSADILSDAWVIIKHFEINWQIQSCWADELVDRQTDWHTHTYTHAHKLTHTRLTARKSKMTVHHWNSPRDWLPVMVGHAYLVFWKWQVLACDQQGGEYGYCSTGTPPGPDFPDLWGWHPDPQCSLHEGPATAHQDTHNKCSAQVQVRKG